METSREKLNPFCKKHKIIPQGQIILKQKFIIRNRIPSIDDVETGDETVNHIISECNKLAQKEYKIRHDWVGKVSHWELYNRSKSGHVHRWHMQKSESILDNEMHTICRDLEIQTDYWILSGRPDLVLISKKKRKCYLESFTVPADHRVKINESKKAD